MAITIGRLRIGSLASNLGGSWNLTPATPTVTINSNTSLTVNNVITGLGKSVTAVEYWGSTDNVTFTKLIKAGATTSYQHDGLENNSIHYYKVRYYSGLYVSGFSETVSGRTDIILLNIQNDNVQTDNFILPIKIHKGENTGDVTTQDIYLNNNCESDFSDVIFTDNNFNELSTYIHSHGNYEFIQAASQSGQLTNLIDNEGVIYATRLKDVVNSYKTVHKSIDDGVTWTNHYVGSGTLLLLRIDSRGYIFMVDLSNYLLMKSTDKGETFSTVLDMSAAEGVINPFGFDEAPNGDLYFGRYQTAFNASIFKSTDAGDTWVEVWNNPVLQHVHGLRIDQVTGYIYAGIDANTGDMCIIRSVDGGANWTTLISGRGYNSGGIVCGDGFRLFSNETSADTSIVRTTDDINFTTVLQTTYSVKSTRYVDGVVYAFGVSFYANSYPAIFRSVDDGVTWYTISIYEYDRGTISAGYANNFLDFASVNGGWLTTAGGENGKIEYPPARLYHGGEHYQSLGYVKIPVLLNGTNTIRVRKRDSTVRDNTIFNYEPSATLLAKWNINEGGGTVISDSSGNGRHGAMREINNGYWNDYGIRRAGSLHPDLLKESHSYHFAGTTKDNSSLVTITGSGTDAGLQMVKNFSVVAWVRPDGGAEQSIIAKGSYNTICWGIRLSGIVGQLTFIMGNGEELSKIYFDAGEPPEGEIEIFAPIGYPVRYMVGFSIDNEEIPNIRFFCNGQYSMPIPLPYEPIANDRPITIGAEQSGTRWMNADMGEIAIYSGQLNEYDFRSIYEGRPVLENTPTVGLIT